MRFAKYLGADPFLIGAIHKPRRNDAWTKSDVADYICKICNVVDNCASSCFSLAPILKLTYVNYCSCISRISDISSSYELMMFLSVHKPLDAEDIIVSCLCHPTFRTFIFDLTSHDDIAKVVGRQFNDVVKLVLKRLHIA